jgi:hypothetical protein
VLFEFAATSANQVRSYDITPDGKRFLVPARLGYIPKEVTKLDFVQNWFEELKRLVPTKNQ